MSTKAPSSWLIAVALCTTLCACGSAPPQTAVRHFGELRLGRSGEEPGPVAADATPTAPGLAALTLRPRLTAPAEPAPVLPVNLDTAAARVAAYLDHAGFALEQRPEGAGRLVSGTRMGPPQTLEAQAVCGLEALHRPDIASTELTVRLTPAPGGVQLEASARFVEVDTRLLSGELARQTCRSRGVLEAAVRRAALAG